MEIKIRFFHGSVQTRKMQNMVSSLMDKSGTEHFSEEEKGNITVDYFDQLFCSSNHDPTKELFDGFETKITTRMNQELIKHVTDAEIKRAVKAIKGDSAPGADGMKGNFFQKIWSITGQQVTIEVKQFFETGSFPKDGISHSFASYPKSRNPNVMTDLSHISLGSVSYKIGSKIPCTRLKKVLPQLISQTQGAFVEGRLIFYNLLIPHEMIHGLRTNTRCKDGFIAIKTDMSKP